MTKQFRIAYAAALFFSFFMPWVSFYGIGSSPYSITTKNFGDSWVLALIPILAGIAVFVDWKDLREKFWLLIAGISPFAILLWMFAKSGGFNQSRSAFSSGFDLSDMIELLDIGFYLALIAGALLVVAYFQQRE